MLESHYKEVSFSTTGQQIVVVSPGTGVYEVCVVDFVSIVGGSLVIVIG